MNGSDASSEVEVIVTCMKRRFSGVSATVDALLPSLGELVPLGYLGVPLPALSRLAGTGRPLRRLTLVEAVAISRRPLADGRPRIWHVRRNAEMLLGLLVRDVLRAPIRLVFTSAAIRRHSRLPRALIGRMDAVIATSPQAAAPVPHVAAVVGHGVDIHRFAPAESMALAWAQGGLPGRRGVGIFGRVRPEKGVHLFVEAMLPLLSRHPDVTAVIGGLCKPADAAFVAELRSRIAAAGHTDRFVWLGEVPSAEMPGWYRRLCVTVACPVYEGYGLTPIEAMASGSAVVASRTGAFETMVVDGETGHLVPTDDVVALRVAIGGLLGDPAAAAAMGRRGRARAVERFSIEAESVAIHAVYRALWAAHADLPITKTSPR